MVSTISYLFKNNSINKESLIALFIILNNYIPSLNTIVTYLPEYTNHIGIINSVNDFIKQINQEILSKPNITINEGLIQIKNLTFSYVKGKDIFNNFSLEIKPKEKVAIVGPSGNGKSTLIKLIMGYYQVNDNNIFIDGKDINNFNLGSIRQQISYINQNTKLFNKTILENIQYGSNITINQLNDLIKKYKLDKVFKNLSNGFNTKVGVNGDSLSGGQKQIIQLLRSYYKESKILILDEPTSALDNETKNIILQIIKDISKDSTLIVITHDTNNLELINRVININTK